MKNLALWIQRLDKAAFVALCGLVVFFPISNASVEIFCVGSILFFLFKRVLLAVEVFRNPATFPRNLAASLKTFFRLPPNFLNGAIVAFLAINLISVGFSQYFSVSVDGFIGKILENVVLFWVVVDVLSSPKRLRIFIWIFLLSSLIYTGNGIAQYIGGYDLIRGRELWQGRMCSVFRHSNDFGAYLGVVVILGLSFWFNRKQISEPTGVKFLDWMEKHKNWILMVVLIPALVCLGGTLSRGAWLGCFIGILCLGLKNRKDLWNLLLMISVFIFVFSPYMLSNRGITIMTYDKSKLATGRIAYWQEAWEIIKDYPYVGVGFNAYSKVVPAYKITGGGYPHNCYLQMWAETGPLGLLAFLGIIGVLFVYGWRRYVGLDPWSRMALWGLLSGLFSFLMQSIIDTHFYSVQLGVLMWICIGVAVALLKSPSVKKL